jgi:ferredoxin
MPKLEVEGVGTFDVERGKRLVLAIEEDAGVDIMHVCGSYARCTTCRIQYLGGEPEEMTQAELIVLNMRVLMRVSDAGARDAGYPPEKEITPPPFWVERPY